MEGNISKSGAERTLVKNEKPYCYILYCYICLILPSVTNIELHSIKWYRHCENVSFRISCSGIMVTKNRLSDINSIICKNRK